jgi:hypothetical protein
VPKRQRDGDGVEALVAAIFDGRAAIGVHEAFDALGLSKDSGIRIVNDGQLAVVRVSQRRWVVTQPALVTYLRRWAETPVRLSGAAAASVERKQATG